MTGAVHGRFVGLNATEGRFQGNAGVLEPDDPRHVQPVDRWDSLGYRHDLQLHRARSRRDLAKADIRYARDAALDAFSHPNLGAVGELASAVLVGTAGLGYHLAVGPDD